MLPGVRLEIAPEKALEPAYGEIAFEGSADSPIRLSGSAGPQSWLGVLVSGGARVRLERVEVSRAGIPGRPLAPGAEAASITVTGGPSVTELALRGVSIRDGADYALWAETTSTSVSCEGVATSGRVHPRC